MVWWRGVVSEVVTRSAGLMRVWGTRKGREKEDAQDALLCARGKRASCLSGTRDAARGSLKLPRPYLMRGVSSQRRGARDAGREGVVVVGRDGHVAQQQVDVVGDLGRGSGSGENAYE